MRTLLPLFCRATPIAKPGFLLSAIVSAVLGLTNVDAATGNRGTADEQPSSGSALHSCPGPVGVVIRPASVADADKQAVCDGAARAIGFLAHAGIDPPASTTIEIVRQMPDELRGRAVGCYRREFRDILLLDYEAFEAGGQWFRMPADRELYRSVAAHEMAHAVVGCHAPPEGLAVAAHEYVAYVVLFATMAPALRNRLLARFPGSGFESTLQINEVNHLLNPNQFAVDAWRHYLKRRDRAAWLREMVSGRLVEDLPRDGP